MTDPAFPIVASSVFRMLLHFLRCADDGVFLCTYFVISDNSSVIVQPHDGTDAEQRAKRGGRSGDSPAAAIKPQRGGEKLVMKPAAVAIHPINDFIHPFPCIPQVGSIVHQHPVTGRGTGRIDHGDLATSAGISAGLDLALHLVERWAGADHALATVRHINEDNTMEVV